MKKNSAMKKLATLLLAAGLVLGAAYPHAEAADIRVSGEWDFNFEWNDVSFAKDSGEDVFRARQRLRTQVEITASENLSGVIFFEIGDTNWGNGAEGASLGTDGITVEVRYSYVDWIVPNTDLKVRMGLQPWILPNYVAGSPILDTDGAGITLNYQFNDNVGLTAFWLRAEHDNAHDNGERIDFGHGEDLDFFGVTVPVTGDGWAVTPWGVYGNAGRNSLVDPDEYGDIGDVQFGLLPYGMSGTDAMLVKDKNTPIWWAGIGGELTFFDPFRVAFDFAYGKADWGKAGAVDLTRDGWLASASVEYKLDMMTPGLIFWYGSGDDDNPANGSEQMPTLVPSWGATTLGWDGAYGIADGAVLGLSPVGTWGIVAQLADLSFMENLTHVLSVGFYTGTNDDEAVKRDPVLFSTAFLENGAYLTKKDHAWEVNFNSEYQIYENLTLALELGYLRLDLDDAVWQNVIDTNSVNENIWKAGLNLNYAF